MVFKQADLSVNLNFWWNNVEALVSKPLRKKNPYFYRVTSSVIINSVSVVKFFVKVQRNKKFAMSLPRLIKTTKLA